MDEEDTYEEESAAEDGEEITAEDGEESAEAEDGESYTNERRSRSKTNDAGIIEAVASLNRRKDKEQKSSKKELEAENKKKAKALTEAIAKTEQLRKEIAQESKTKNEENLKKLHGSLDRILKTLNDNAPKLSSTDDEWKETENAMKDRLKAMDQMKGKIMDMFETREPKVVLKSLGISQGYLMDTESGVPKAKSGVLDTALATGVINSKGAFVESEYFSFSEHVAAKTTYEKTGSSWNVSASGKVGAFIGQGVGSVAVKTTTTSGRSRSAQSWASEHVKTKEYVMEKKFISRAMDAHWGDPEESWTDKARASLQKVNNLKKARRFLENYGTHQSARVSLGTSFILTIKSEMEDSVSKKELHKAYASKFDHDTSASASYFSPGVVAKASAAVTIKKEKEGGEKGSSKSQNVKRTNSIKMEANPANLLALNEKDEFVYASGFSGNWTVAERTDWRAVWEILPPDTHDHDAKRLLLIGAYRDILSEQFPAISTYWGNDDDSLDSWERYLKSFTMLIYHASNGVLPLVRAFRDSISLDELRFKLCQHTDFKGKILTFNIAITKKIKDIIEKELKEQIEKRKWTFNDGLVSPTNETIKDSTITASIEEFYLVQSTVGSNMLPVYQIQFILKRGQCKAKFSDYGFIQAYRRDGNKWNEFDVKELNNQIQTNKKKINEMKNSEKLVEVYSKYFNVNGDLTKKWDVDRKETFDYEIFKVKPPRKRDDWKCRINKDKKGCRYQISAKVFKKVRGHVKIYSQEKQLLHITKYKIGRNYKKLNNKLNDLENISKKLNELIDTIYRAFSSERGRRVHALPTGIIGGGAYQLIVRTSKNISVYQQFYMGGISPQTIREFDNFKNVLLEKCNNNNSSSSEEDGGTVVDIEVPSSMRVYEIGRQFDKVGLWYRLLFKESRAQLVFEVNQQDKKITFHNIVDNAATDRRRPLLTNASGSSSSSMDENSEKWIELKFKNEESGDDDDDDDDDERVGHEFRYGGLRSEDTSEVDHEFRYGGLCSADTSEDLALYDAAKNDPHRAYNINRRGRRLWMPGDVLKYYFFDDRRKDKHLVGSEKEKALVRKGFQKWKDIGIGLTTKEVFDRSEAHIRIAFDKRKVGPNVGCWSYIGRDVLDYDDDEPTMNFGWNILREFDTVLHEIGHSFGFKHEHQNGNTGIVWNEEKVLEDCEKPPINWDRETTRSNVLNTVAPDAHASKWDPNSIMQYPYKKGWIKEPKKYRNGLTPKPGFSQTDLKFVTTYYPPQGKEFDDLLKRPLNVGEKTRLEGEDGERVTFSIQPPTDGIYCFETQGADFDAFMCLYEVEDDGMQYLAADDDSGLSHNAKIEIDLSSDTQYVLRVRLHWTNPEHDTPTLTFKKVGDGSSDEDDDTTALIENIHDDDDDDDEDDDDSLTMGRKDHDDDDNEMRNDYHVYQEFLEELYKRPAGEYCTHWFEYNALKVKLHVNNLTMDQGHDDDDDDEISSYRVTMPSGKSINLAYDSDRNKVTLLPNYGDNEGKNMDLPADMDQMKNKRQRSDYQMFQEFQAHVHNRPKGEFCRHTWWCEYAALKVGLELERMDTSGSSGVVSRYRIHFPNGGGKILIEYDTKANSVKILPPSSQSLHKNNLGRQHMMMIA